MMALAPCSCMTLGASLPSTAMFVPRGIMKGRDGPLRGGRGRVAAAFLADASVIVNPWSPSIDSESIAPQLFAASLFPYIGFLYHLTKSNSAPKLTLFGFYFLLVFVAATIPAGIYAKIHYGTSLSNVDWLHGGAESFLTITNILIVLGLRKALRNSTATSSEEERSKTVKEDSLSSTKFD